jgi:hypothetical protein
MRHRDPTGQPLLEVDLTESIAAVRPLFRGSRLAALDDRIQSALAAPELVQCLAQLSAIPRALALHADDAAR